MPIPPNIVFIMADDLGYADVGRDGRPELHTPNIDRIAARGVRLTQAYANSAVCSATRLALITGPTDTAFRSDWKNRWPARPMLACRQISRHCPPCYARPAMRPRWSANGISVCRRGSAR